MERFSLLIVAPPKLKGLGKEIENIKKIQDRNIFMQVEECIDSKTLLNIVSQGVKPDFLLLFESITENRSNTEKAHTELLDCLRKIKFSSSTKIVIILQHEHEKELQLFVNELIKLDIQDFHFASDFNADDVIHWLLIEKKELKDNQKYIITEIAAKGEKEVVIKEVPKYIEVSAEIPSKKGFSLFNKNKKESVSLHSSEKNRITKTIGITGTSRGVGVTSLCMELADMLSRMNKRVAVVERNDAAHLTTMTFFKNKYIDIFNCPLHGIDVANYDYIILDFGVFFELNTKDITYICSSKADVQKKEIACGIEKKYCHNMILVAAAVPWRLKEAEFYINDLSCKDETKNWIFYFNGNPGTKYFDDFACKYEGSRNMILSFNNKESISELISLMP